jgi:hypothetical protein
MKTAHNPLCLYSRITSKRTASGFQLCEFRDSNRNLILTEEFLVDAVKEGVIGYVAHALLQANLDALYTRTEGQ